VATRVVGAVAANDGNQPFSVTQLRNRNGSSCPHNRRSQYPSGPAQLGGIRVFPSRVPVDACAQPFIHPLRFLCHAESKRIGTAVSSLS
jgi:hypothetical protein